MRLQPAELFNCHRRFLPLCLLTTWCCRGSGSIRRVACRDKLWGACSTQCQASTTATKSRGCPCGSGAACCEEASWHARGYHFNLIVWGPVCSSQWICGGRRVSAVCIEAGRQTDCPDSKIHLSSCLELGGYQCRRDCRLG
ncbi:hypothetical protein FOVG_19083 [Fusarium oxysporum f. sp. pisi HDV247]|uniref:Uncharacterized protein n=1 Tax=Fusarium oxysporum f. sp. pisi HDV247 TaxID=1080344 RepID=W9NCX7_FUSOX|nr:hypothetical protein FOVG_19832 [Fusarium oxysporum f. sp. pisi HDV247]EXA29444.1 hypothetical protein FOVG_19083 [Fusarium oxysporum f. sp. pisi HDV247]